LYQTAGAKLAFDADTLKKAISLLETKIQELGSNGNNLWKI